MPFVEMTVAHASVLTILAISFERYYVITRPLRAGYTCTRMRALLIILAIWVLGCLTSRYVVRSLSPPTGNVANDCLLNTTTGESRVPTANEKGKK